MKIKKRGDMNRLILIFVLTALAITAIPFSNAFLGEVKGEGRFSRGVSVEIPTDKPYVITGFGAKTKIEDFKCKFKQELIQYAEILPNCTLGERKLIGNGNLQVELPDNSFLVGIGGNVKDCEYKKPKVAYRTINPDCTLSDIFYIEGDRGPEQWHEYSNSAIVGISLTTYWGGEYHSGSHRMRTRYREISIDYDVYSRGCYNWLPGAPYDPTGQKNYCCGDDIEDEGALKPEEDNPDIGVTYRYVCAKEYIDEWAWVDASQAPLYIIPIKEQYDVASNGKNWWACTPPGILTMPVIKRRIHGQVLEPYSGYDAKRLLCYADGDKNYFAECCLPGFDCVAEEYTQSRIRREGEPANLLDSSGRYIMFESGPLSSAVNIKGAPYQGIAVSDTTNKITDWRYYNAIEFFVNANSLDVPIEFSFARLKGMQDNDIAFYDVLFSSRLDDFVVNGVGEDKWMHVVVPINQIDGADNVTHILFFVNVSAVPFGKSVGVVVKRIFFRTDEMHYCSEPPEGVFEYWITDLDANNATCDGWPSYGWTGTKCCGDDGAEYYIDSAAGCWKGNPAYNNTKVTDNTVFYDNMFYVCGNPNGAPGGLYEMAASCDVIGSFSCLHSGEWVEDARRNMTREAPSGIAVPLMQECCAYDECWNGTACVSSRSEPYIIDNESFICGYGQWFKAVIRYDWNNDKFGFCPRPSDCLVNPYGNDANNYNPDSFTGLNYDSPVCIANGQYIEDHYCRNGTWTTRTRMIALQLLGIRSTAVDFALYCDYYNLSLADYRYGDVEDYLGGPVIQRFPFPRSCFDGDYTAPCVNHFCIMKYGDKVLFGTSLNRAVNDSERSFLKAINKGFDFCDRLSGGVIGGYQKCSGYDNVWYNPATRSIIYSRDGVALYQTTWGAIKDFFSRIFSIFTGWKPKNIFNQTINLTAVEINENYDRLYLQRFGDKSVAGILVNTEPGRSMMVVHYENFTLPVCESIERTEVVGLVCNETDKTAMIVGNTDKAIAYWQDMTSRLRLR